MTRTGAAWDLQSFSCTVCHPNQSCIVSQWIRTWINTEAPEASGKTAVIVPQPMAFSRSGIDSREILSFFPFSLSSLPRSENYLVKWSSSGLVKDIDQLHNLRAVFTVRVSVRPDVCLCPAFARLW